MKVSFVVNGKQVAVDVLPDTPLLWVLRDELGLVGTKGACLVGECGSCTVHVNGRAVCSCSVPARSVAGKSVTTIEGLSGGDTLHPVQQAWIDEDVAQCGFCAPGQIMRIAALLARTPNPSDDAIETALEGHVCVCGSYSGVKKAVRRAAAARRGTKR